MSSETLAEQLRRWWRTPDLLPALHSTSARTPACAGLSTTEGSCSTATPTACRQGRTLAWRTGTSSPTSSPLRPLSGAWDWPPCNLQTCSMRRKLTQGCYCRLVSCLLILRSLTAITHRFSTHQHHEDLELAGWSSQQSDLSSSEQSLEKTWRLFTNWLVW